MGERLIIPSLPDLNLEEIDQIETSLEDRIANGGRVFYANVEMKAGDASGLLLFLSPEGAHPGSQYKLEESTLVCYINRGDPNPVPCETVRIEANRLQDLLRMQSNFALEQ